MTRFVDGSVGFDHPMPPEGVFEALDVMHRTWGIDCVLPGDEPAVGLLHAFARGYGVPPEGRDSPINGILARSLGDAGFHDAIARKSGLATLTIPGLACPRQTVCSRADDLLAAAAAFGYPLILKRDFQSGGTGVYGIESEADVRRFLASADGEAAKGTERFILQDWIRGVAAASAFSSLNGRVLASFAYRRVTGWPDPFGPTCVAEVVENPAMTAMTEALVAHFGFTGFGGLDFILGEDGDARFLEFNARPTLTSHLGAVMGADLCAAFHAALTGQAPPAATRIRHRLVALFPREWRRDANSPHLHEAYHDVPWNDAGLMRAFTQVVLSPRSSA